MPLCTQSQWGWHTSPFSSENYNWEENELKPQLHDNGKRKVPYATSSNGQAEVYHWLRQNPHRLHLGRIGLEMLMEDGSKVQSSDIKNIEQKLNLWEGILQSSFSLEGYNVKTVTCCHPEKDILTFSVESDILQVKKLKITIDFPYGSAKTSAADWESDEKHSTEVINYADKSIELMRMLDRDRYFVEIECSQNGKIKRIGRNSFVVEVSGEGNQLECVCSFTSSPKREKLPTFSDIVTASKIHWESFWNEGGAVELAGSNDTRAIELERRIVLSQYLTAIQCGGTLPPQETGLTCNSWYGKFHLEMHWWHSSHFPLWGRFSYLEKSLWWYKSILDKARDKAKRQGYMGARWPKMTALDGFDSPSPIGPLLIWQQPHPIYYAELLYRSHPDKETLEMYREIVWETAEFMASYAEYDEGNDRYVLGRSLIPAQENHRPEDTINPTLELEYWIFGLSTAINWMKRLGTDYNPIWKAVVEKLSPLPVKDGVYLAHENCPCTFEKYNEDHPSMLGALGMLPGCTVDKQIMGNTLDRVLKEWELYEMWGWDFPMMAMTAARLGKPEVAVDMLLLDSPKNTYLPNGHNRQGTRSDLPLYLPGNGGLLTAVAMMAAGWDNCDPIDAPGFPKNGEWKVSWEGLNRLL
jgi:protein-glucosylgalactosylhydroxylysine glucosidase